ncbi:hypothetical protein L2E82_26016 [Cichorium intybus]|uniref:Uncharacterized protein n=1 Tax=Cichorium intybus TaxID=13427 RepID=A0ACB9E5F4_CICIN|nr:hypothetical protein L2E82_26016 [Cichorium intybus]
MVVKTYVVLLLVFLICKTDNVCCRNLAGEETTSLEHGEGISKIGCDPTTRISCGINDIKGRGGYANGDIESRLVYSTDDPEEDSTRELLIGIDDALTAINGRFSTDLMRLVRLAAYVTNAIRASKRNAMLLRGIVINFGASQEQLIGVMGSNENIQRTIRRFTRESSKNLTGNVADDTKERLDVGPNNGGQRGGQVGGGGK